MIFQANENIAFTFVKNLVAVLFAFLKFWFALSKKQFIHWNLYIVHGDMPPVNCLTN